MKVYNTQETTKHKIGNYLFEIARANNAKFRDKFRRITQTKQRQIDSHSLTAAEDDKIMAQAMAGTILVGWTMVQSSGEPEIPFSLQEAEATLIEDDVLKEQIIDISNNYNLFLQKDEDELVKN